MRAVSTGYGDITPTDEPAVVSDVVSPSEVPESEEVAVVAEAPKRSSKTKAALASILGAVGIGAAPLLGL